MLLLLADQLIVRFMRHRKVVYIILGAGLTLADLGIGFAATAHLAMLSEEIDILVCLQTFAVILEENCACLLSRGPTQPSKGFGWTMHHLRLLSL